MLLKDLSKESVSLDEYRIIAEIFLDRMGFQSASNAVADAHLTKIFADPKRPIASILQYAEQAHGLPKESIKQLGQSINEFLLTVRREDLLYEYCFTHKIEAMIVRETERNDSEPLAPEEIVPMFAEDTRRYYTVGYQIGTQPPIAYLTNAYKSFFVNSRWQEIYAKINTRGTMLSLDDGDVSISDLLYIEIDKPEAMDFRKVASTIYNSSEVLYSLSGGSGEPDVYYDLFSKFKNSKIIEIENKIKKVFQASFGKKIATPEISTRDVNDKTAGYDYKHHTLRSRNTMIELLEPYLGHCIPPSRLNSLYEEFKKLDENRPNRNNSNALFKAGTGSGKNLSNVEKFNIIVYGFSSVSYLLKYLNKVGISPFDVPSTIFQDSSYIKRFKTLQEYLLAHAKTEELIEHSSKVVEMIPTNDEMYDNLSGPLKNRLTSYRFSSIKDIIDGSVNMNDIKKQGDYLNYGLIKEVRTRAFKDMSLVSIGNDRRENKTIAYLHALINKLNDSGWTGCIYTGTGIGVNWDRDHSYTVDYSKAMLPANPTIDQTIEGIMSNTCTGEDVNVHQYFQRDQMILDLLRYFHLKVGVLSAIYDLALKLSSVSNYLQFLDLCEKQPRLFEIPLEYKDIQSITRILSDYKVPLLLEPDGDIASLSDKYKMMYGFALDGYEKFLKYVNDHRVNLYNDLAENYICKTNMFNITSNVLKTRATELVYIREHTTPRFSVFKSMCDIGDYDYLYKEGKPYTEAFGGDVRYLHSKGYWVYLNDLNIEEVSINDSFGGIV